MVYYVSGGCTSRVVGTRAMALILKTRTQDKDAVPSCSVRPVVMSQLSLIA